MSAVHLLVLAFTVYNYVLLALPHSSRKNQIFHFFILFPVGPTFSAFSWHVSVCFPTLLSLQMTGNFLKAEEMIILQFYQCEAYRLPT